MEGKQDKENIPVTDQSRPTSNDDASPEAPPEHTVASTSATDQSSSESPPEETAVTTLATDQSSSESPPEQSDPVPSSPAQGRLSSPLLPSATCRANVNQLSEDEFMEMYKSMITRKYVHGNISQDSVAACAHQVLGFIKTELTRNPTFLEPRQWLAFGRNDFVPVASLTDWIPDGTIRPLAMLAATAYNHLVTMMLTALGKHLASRTIRNWHRHEAHLRMRKKESNIAYKNLLLKGRILVSSAEPGEGSEGEVIADPEVSTGEDEVPTSEPASAGTQDEPAEAAAAESQTEPAEAAAAAAEEHSTSPTERFNEMMIVGRSICQPAEPGEPLSELQSKSEPEQATDAMDNVEPLPPPATGMEAMDDTQNVDPGLLQPPATTAEEAMDDDTENVDPGGQLPPPATPEGLTLTIGNLYSAYVSTLGRRCNIYVTRFFRTDNGELVVEARPVCYSDKLLYHPHEIESVDPSPSSRLEDPAAIATGPEVVADIFEGIMSGLASAESEVYVPPSDFAAPFGEDEQQMMPPELPFHLSLPSTSRAAAHGDDRRTRRNEIAWAKEFVLNELQSFDVEYASVKRDGGDTVRICERNAYHMWVVGQTVEHAMPFIPLGEVRFSRSLELLRDHMLHFFLDKCQQPFSIGLDPK